jgi:hypothetical protein
MDQTFTARVCRVAQIAKTNGYEDVAAWMQKHLTNDAIAERARKPRKRSVKVQLTKAKGAVAYIEEKRLNELMNGNYQKPGTQ